MKPLLLAFLFVVVGGMYALLPTRNYYWDGINSAQTIEDATRAKLPTLFQPNHLVYNLFGLALYSEARHFGIRSLTVLQFINIVSSALAAVVMCIIVRNLSGSDFLGLNAALLFAFSAAWWKFSTDANSYILSVLLLMVITYLILCARQTRPVLIALVHVLAMLFHQLAVFVFPAVIAGLFMRTQGRARVRAVSLYSTIVSSLTVAGYYAGFVVQKHEFSIADFERWVTSHSSDSHFTFTILNNVITSLRSQLKLFLDGRLPAAMDGRNIIEVLLGILWAISLVILIRALIIHRQTISDFVRSFAKCLERTEFVYAGIWALTYAAFLLFWQPQNTFYRFFYLPALILMFTIPWRECFRSDSSAKLLMAALVVAIGLFNLAFYIYPYAQVRANPPLALALEARSNWPAGTKVIFGEFNTDNWTIRYFNPQTSWIALGDLDSKKLNEISAQAQKKGGAVWFDQTALDRISVLPICEDNSGPELLNARYHIHFVRAVPCPRSSEVITSSQ